MGTVSVCPGSQSTCTKVCTCMYLTSRVDYTLARGPIGNSFSWPGFPVNLHQGLYLYVLDKPRVDYTLVRGPLMCVVQLGTVSVGPGSQSTCTKVCTCMYLTSRVDYTLVRGPLMCVVQLGTVSVGPGSQSTCTKVCTCMYLTSRVDYTLARGPIGNSFSWPGFPVNFLQGLYLYVLDKPRVDYTLVRGPLMCVVQLGTVSVGPGSQSTCTKVCTCMYLTSRVDYTLGRGRLSRGDQLGAIGPIGLRPALVIIIFLFFIIIIYFFDTRKNTGIRV